eukprot:1190781-Prorocentrum_minimum.AAC.1
MRGVLHPGHLHHLLQLPVDGQCVVEPAPVVQALRLTPRPLAQMGVLHEPLAHLEERPEAPRGVRVRPRHHLQDGEHHVPPARGIGGPRPPHREGGEGGVRVLPFRAGARAGDERLVDHLLHGHQAHRALQRAQHLQFHVFGHAEQMQHHRPRLERSEPQPPPEHPAAHHFDGLAHVVLCAPHFREHLRHVGALLRVWMLPPGL